MDRLDGFELSIERLEPSDIVDLSAIWPRSTQTYSPIEFSEGANVFAVERLEGFILDGDLAKKFFHPLKTKNVLQFAVLI